jgi:hypothetical protein
MSHSAIVSPELFNSIGKDMSAFIRKKLSGMEIDAIEVELHNSSLTKRLQVYITVSRTNNLKALHLAEHMICEEIEHQFSLRPHAFFWRYLPEHKSGNERAPATPATP